MILVLASMPLLAGGQTILSGAGIVRQVLAHQAMVVSQKEVATRIRL